MEDLFSPGAAAEARSDAPLSVSAAMALAKNSLESVTVTLVGEVSEVSVKPGYKAAYFTVKDQSASLPCMMWNNRYYAQGVQLAVGQLVQLTGRFTLYAAKGRMNFDVFGLSLAGEGDLRLKVANIARRLQAEGLTDPARKRPVPQYPQRIGLVTSPRSAAVHDVLRTLRRRFPVAEVLLAGVPVEGAAAAAGIVDGLACVVRAGAEVVLVVRGGGSFEDLMPFNDERLARTIAACPVPVVTGVGHEVDTTIADMVSDLRASTPTAAAEAVSPSREGLEEYFASRAQVLGSRARHAVQQAAAGVARLADRPVMADPLQLFASDAQALDLAADRLSAALPRNVERNEQQVHALRMRLASALPHGVQRRAQQLDALQDRMAAMGANVLARFQNETASGAARLNDLSPLATIARGYSITRTGAGDVVRSVAQVSAGADLTVTVSDGDIACVVK